MFSSPNFITKIFLRRSFGVAAASGHHFLLHKLDFKTKLASFSVSLSFCFSVSLSLCLSLSRSFCFSFFSHSLLQTVNVHKLDFKTKLASLSVFPSFSLSAFLSLSLYVFLSVCLTNCLINSISKQNQSVFQLLFEKIFFFSSAHIGKII